MPTAVERMVRKLRVQSLATENDRELLEAFAHGGDEEAFAEIVRRHGPLVLGVCRRILGNVQDAEDAFQATFLVLAKKASSVAWRESVKNWLHGVACRIAMKARCKSIKRKQLDKNIERPIATAATPADAWSELRPILDQELQQIPSRYREVLILCYLEGKTRDEAAEQLGWSLGSVKGCLERGREMLRTRLAKRGIALSAALAAGLLSEATGSAAMITTSLQAATIQSAAHFAAGSMLTSPAVYLAQGALNAMLVAKIKSASFAMMLFFAATTALWGVSQMDGGNGTPLSVVQVAHGQEIRREQGKDGEKKKAADFFGMIKAIDLKQGTMAIQSLKDGDSNDVVFNLTSKDLKVESTLGEALKLADLTVGLRVHLELKDQDITSMKVENPRVPGSITSVDVEKRIIYARADRMNAEYSVARDAKFMINGQQVPLMKLPLEQRVFLTLSFDKKTVLAVTGNKIVQDGRRPAPEKDKERPGAEKGKGERPVERPGAIQGTIVDVDAAKSSFNFLMGRGDELSIQTITLGKDQKVSVQFDEKVVGEFGLAQLTKPLNATVVFAEDKKSVKSVTVSAPTMRAVIASIDVPAKKINVITEGRQEKTLSLSAHVVIRSGGSVIQAEKLTIANTNAILGLSLDRERVIGITIVPPTTRREGDR